ncbi:MAG: hypothetical protein R2848_08945 [Thermomicrobiales bacterium]
MGTVDTRLLQCRDQPVTNIVRTNRTDELDLSAKRRRGGCGIC